ncbi:MAG: amidase [Candidatus Rokubacteria bacterium]|nr:amidase [Candidatus Rokubacteria bacterium]
MAGADLAWRSAVELAGLIRDREVSPVEVTDAILARIAELGPLLNAFCTVAEEEARDAALAAEVAVLSGEPLPPLHGVPVSVKDLIFTRRIRTTGGSRLFVEHYPEEDAVSVERLRAAGAVIIGKTATPEFGHKGMTDSPLFGITRNPWNLEMTPGGSSGGAAAAVAAGLGPFALGTDGGGSIRIPASFCGIYGLKPSFGRVPSGPGFPGWETFSHTGPMARTVRDAALMLDALAGPDDRDRHSLPADAGGLFLAACDAGIAGLSVAWAPDLGRALVDPEVAALCERAAVEFESLGCHVEAVVPTWEDPEEIFRVMAAAETFAAWGGRLADAERELDRTLVAFLRFGQTVTAAQYLEAARRRRELWGEVQRFLARFDLLITPTMPVPAFPAAGPPPAAINGRAISPLGWVPFTFPFNLTGQPAATVPAGFTASGLPVGLQIVGRRHADRTVLAASAAFEAAAPWSGSRPAVVPRPPGACG